jgi:nitrite reductase/ring-hydroxylating ferredoxin subunit
LSVMTDCPRLLDLKAPPTAGKTYLVPVTDLGGMVKPFPVLGHKHNDVDIGQPDIDHIHIDVRFVSDEALRESGFTEAQVRNQYSDTPGVVGALAFRTDLCGAEPRVWEEPSVCVREEFPQGLEYKVGAWGELHRLALRLRDEGFRLKPDCKTCPHKGTRLDNVKAKKGVLVCPAHGLEFAPDTGEVIRG